VKLLLKKIIRKIKNFWKDQEFASFQKRINKKTIQEHKVIYEWALGQNTNKSKDTTNDFKDIRNSLFNKYRNMYAGNTSIKVLVHVPSARYSPAGFSQFSSLVESLIFIGIDSERLDLHNDVNKQLDKSKPTVLLTSDDRGYLNKLDWNALKKYKQNHKLLIGLTASIEAYGNTSLSERLKWADNNKIDFYYSQRSPEYIQNREDYRSFFEFGYQIHSMELGANPLRYYPISGIKKDIPFVFFGSSNADKHSRYIEWFEPLLTRSPGFINGPGWNKMSTLIPMDLNKFILARAKVGINLHLEEQLNWACELNERTYALAACGVPQLIDNPRLLYERFSSDAFFVASTAKEYAELFDYLTNNSQEANKRAKIALHEVYSRHTTFHRAEGLVKYIKTLLN
tara:strand:- start:132 stop:1325 length:1194 start_codon:yes stop_codon:yes gene_type:complete